jgi:hypothetical protein
VAGMPASASSVFAKRSLRLRFLDPLGLSLGILDPWSPTRCMLQAAPCFCYTNS